MCPADRSLETLVLDFTIQDIFGEWGHFDVVLFSVEGQDFALGLYGYGYNYILPNWPS